MSNTAPHLVDHVIARDATLLGVSTFPFATTLTQALSTPPRITDEIALDLAVFRQ